MLWLMASCFAAKGALAVWRGMSLVGAFIYAMRWIQFTDRCTRCQERGLGSREVHAFARGFRHPGVDGGLLRISLGMG